MAMSRNRSLLLATTTIAAGAYLLYPKYKPFLSSIASSISSTATRLLEGIESIEEEASNLLSTPISVSQDHTNKTECIPGKHDRKYSEAVPSFDPNPISIAPASFRSHEAQPVPEDQATAEATSCIALANNAVDANTHDFLNVVEDSSQDACEDDTVQRNKDSEDCPSEDSQSCHGRSDTSSEADTPSSRSSGSLSSTLVAYVPGDAGMKGTKNTIEAQVLDTQTTTADSIEDGLEVISDAGDDISESDDKTKNDELAPFRRLIDDFIDLDAFADMALRIRTFILLQHGKLKHGWGKKKRRLTCAIDENPLSGTFNLVYKVVFSDGVHWALRIPGYGNYGEKEYMDKMNSEYNTMRYIRSKTSIPMPEIYFWDASDEELGTAYAFMEWIEGKSLEECWFEPEWRSEERRLNVLTSIANHMAQLHTLEFDQIGTLRFTDKGDVSHVDAFMIVRGWEAPWEFIQSVGPFAKSKDALLDDWRQEPGERKSASLSVLRQAIHSIPDFMFNDGKYPLSVSDFNPQNILVNKKGQIVSFIDWDGVATEPACMGSARLPTWITRDWDPACYAWEPEGQDLEKYKEEDSPETLLRYRRHYANAFAKAAQGQHGYDDRQTSLSHIVEAISIAIGSTVSRGEIVSRLLDHAFSGKTPFTLFDYANAYENGTSEAQYDGKIKAAFEKMWDVKKHTYEQT